MAKAQKSKVKRAEWKGYCKVNLTREQNEVFENEHAALQINPAELDILVNDGYKISFSWDDYNSGVSASLYATNAKMEWAGYSLSAWAGDVQTALNLLLFKHFVVAEQRWEIVKDERAGSDVKWG